MAGHERTRGWTRTVGVVIAVGLSAGMSCSAKRPVLYPNAHYQRVGPEAAGVEIDACLAAADADGFGSRRASRTAGRTGGAAATGAAVGAAVGAVHGGAGRGAAAGAAGGSAGGLLRSLFRWRDPDRLQARYVDICLRDRGYQPIGWR